MDIQATLIQVHYWIKAEVALNIVDVTKGPHIFRYTPPDSQKGVIITTAVEKVTVITSADDISSLLNQRFQVGQSSLLTVTYLDRARGGLHDTILTEFCNSFFAGFRKENHIFSNGRKNTTE